MEHTLHQLYSNGTLLVMWGALLVNLLLPLPRHSHPMALWREFARLLADKVNTQRSYSQSLLSGRLSLLLMLLPALVVLIALKPLVWKVELFNLALLILALDWRGNRQLCKQLSQAMNQEDKQQGRLLLAPVVNRQTQTLSMVGLGKAGAETIISGYGRNVICVLFWYALAGGIGAFMYRLVAELQRSWSPSRSQFAPFGQGISELLALMDVVPLRLFALLTALGKNLTGVLSQSLLQARSWRQPGTGWLLCVVGNKLQLALGGPAIYNEKKALRAKLGGRIVPAAIHLQQIQHLLTTRIILWIALQSLLLGLIYQGV